jgi:aldose 1-epimerase
MTVHIFEETPQVFRLEHPNGMRIAVMDQGATWLSCELPLPCGARREVLLGCNTPSDYARQSAYLGATIGRYANRIANARFVLDGQAYQLAPNNGPHNLHGGPRGFDAQRWLLVSHNPSELVLALDSPDGDQGFPGRAQLHVRYLLTDHLGVLIEFSASVDAACPIGLTNHAYFNLDGSTSDGCVQAHRLRMAAERFVPIDSTLIPIAESREVVGSAFDFRQLRRIGGDWLQDEQMCNARGYDHSFLLDASVRSGERAAAQLCSGDGRVGMHLYTDQPALQCYTGNYLADTPARDGGVYVAHAGIALEPGFPPDSPNRSDAAACILRPGRCFRSFIRYDFEVSL